MPWNMFSKKKKRMLAFLGFHRNPGQLQMSVILVWKEPIKLAVLFLGNNSLDDYKGIFAFTVKKSSFCQLLFPVGVNLY